MRRAESEPSIQGSWHSGHQDPTISLKVQGPPRAPHPQPRKADREVRTKAGSARVQATPLQANSKLRQATGQVKTPTVDASGLCQKSRKIH